MASNLQIQPNPTIYKNGALIALNPYSLNFTGAVTITNDGPYITLNVTGGGTGSVTSVGTSAPLTGGPITTSGTIGITKSGIATDGYLSSTDWNTFNSKQPSGTYLTSVAIASSNGFAGSSSGGATPTITLSTTITGLLKGNGTAISAATAADITSQLITGYVSGAGTITAADTILTAINKLNGNTAALVTGVSSVNSLTGAVPLTGTTNRITVSGANVFDISASYVGQSSIITLGTITTGVWNGTAIANANLANSTISGISLGGTLGALTATDTTLTFSGSYTGATARTVGINLSNTNIWAGLQTFGNNISIGGAQLNVTSLTNNDYLKYNGTNWVNTQVTPAWTTFTSTITGFSGTPTQTCSALTLGKTMFARISITGTSNASTFTFTLPSNTIAVQFQWAQIQNNTGTKAGSMVSTRAASNVVDVYVSAGVAANTWVTSGTKGVEVTMTVELA